MEAIRQLDTLVFELQDKLDVSAVISGSSQLGFEHMNGAIYIFLERSYEEGELIQVGISYGGDAGQDRGFFAGISSRADYNYGFDVTYTLSEPLNASDWFPVKQVLEDKIDSVTFRITCDTDLMAGSNGILVDVSEDKRSHTFTWKTRYPMAYYLFPLRWPITGIIHFMLTFRTKATPCWCRTLSTIRMRYMLTWRRRSG